MELSASLEHANMNVRDLGRSLAFYASLLPGWGIRWEGRTSTGRRWVHFGPTAEPRPTYLSLYEDEAARSQADESSLRVQHLGFAHPDVDALALDLSAKGIVPTDRVDDGAYRRVYFLDPDGHELELVQRLA